MKILLLEDDLSLQKGIAFKLCREGHEVALADSVAAARRLSWSALEMAVLDVNLPDGSGLDLCRELRTEVPGAYLLILTANDAETDVVMGYDLGADDYMTKPFSLAVLLAKINAVRRRGETQDGPAQPVFDRARQTVLVRGQAVLLTKNEARLLDALLRSAGRIVTKEQLLETLWDRNGDFVNENTLAVNIRRLREKIEPGSGAPRAIENVRGVGYRLNLEVFEEGRKAP